MNEKHNPRSTPPFGVIVWVWDITYGRSVSTEGILPFVNDRPREAKVTQVWGGLTLRYFGGGEAKVDANRLLWWHTKEECARYMFEELLRRGRVLEEIAERTFECAFKIQEEYRLYETP